MTEKTVLAIDLGAESGRVMAVHFDGLSLRLEEVNRFANVPVTVHGTLHWDVLRLWGDIQAGITAGRAYQPASMGVDTWGVDFGLLDKQGHLIGNPVHYRDGRTAGMMDKVLAIVSKADVFEQTGLQFLPINTLYQLMSLVDRQAPDLRIAATFLTMPDLLNYWLTGAKVSEFTNASTTQLFNPRTGDWATELMVALGLPDHIFPDIVRSGTHLGDYEGIPVIAPACHDTGSAVAAVPVQTPNFAYISSGTWSLVGLEVDEPLINEAALAADLTNEGGVYGTFRLLKNVMGLWIVQQCRAAWAGAGRNYTYAELTQLARKATPLRSLINVNDPVFLAPGDHPQHVRDYCARTGQTVPETPGAIVRTVLESLALAYHDVLKSLMALSGRSIDFIHIVGGGSQNDLLNQLTADATDLPVLAGPIEATALGNALVQLITLGDVRDLAEARQLVMAMGELKRYEPNFSVVAWQDAYERYKQLG
ncbi:MAG: rhamnulokinase [Anaerolineae bacterium]|nr:rhamnulokinase [Anaerolineae bacterium]